MPSNRHSLSELPFLVLDGILENLDQNSLASLSLSCRSIHHETLKYLYRDLTCYEPHSHQIEQNLRNDPTLIRYIHSFSSYDRSFLEWMYSQIPALRPDWLKLECLDVKWGTYWHNTAYSFPRFVESIPAPTRVDITTLSFTLNSRSEGSLFHSLSSFRKLHYLTLYNKYGQPWYTLQDVLDQLCAPSLRFLEIDYVDDWRVQWRDSYGQAFPNLMGVQLSTQWADKVMWDPWDQNVDEDNNPSRPLSARMLSTFLEFTLRDIFFDVLLETKETPFLDRLPSLAASHGPGLSPIQLVLRHVAGRYNFSAAKGLDHFDINVGVVPLPDLMTILHAMTPTESFQLNMHLSLNLPCGTTSSIAQLLPHKKNIVELSVAVNVPDVILVTPTSSDLLLVLDPSVTLVFLDPSVIPACISALPNLDTLTVSLKTSANEFQPINTGTVSTCTFPSFPEGRFVEKILLQIGQSEPIWEVYFSSGEGETLSDKRGNRYYEARPTIEQYDLGEGVRDFEMEVRDWFGLSSSLRLVEVEFERMKF